MAAFVPTAVWLGASPPEGIEGLDHVTDLSQIPSSARLVVLPASNSLDVKALRSTVSAARIVCWFAEAVQDDEVTEMFELGFDDIVVGIVHLRRCLETSLQDSRLVAAYAQRVANHAGITELVAAISEQPACRMSFVLQYCAWPSSLPWSG